ncbi:MAG TPA: hypothetical protein VKB84_14255 [Candidatus Binataceae bacterium]|nr:hypothetical protein [Candidatus Binataceae bacterium]
MADTTLADMRARIMDELQRTDLAGQINNAITEAADYFRRDAFFRNDAQDSSTVTVAGTNVYPAPADVAEIRQLAITVFNTKYPLRLRSWEYINAEDSNTQSPISGPPVEYAVNLLSSGMSIRLFPTPDAAYRLQYDYIQIIPAPVHDTDSNFWTMEGREMVRAYAKYLLRMTVLNDPQSAQIDQELADLYFRKLKQETGMKKFTGRLRAHW